MNESALHNIYNKEFYEDDKDVTIQSAEVIVPLVLQTFTINSVIDVGCGDGIWLSFFEKNGVREIIGLDVSDLPSENYFIKKNKIRTNCDFSSPEFILDSRADLTICLEVAEHLPESASDNLVQNLIRSAPVIIFSAAYPDQTGTNHINEQPPWYWREKFNRRGYFEIDFLRPESGKTNG